MARHDEQAHDRYEEAAFSDCVLELWSAVTLVVRQSAHVTVGPQGQ